MYRKIFNPTLPYYKDMYEIEVLPTRPLADRQQEYGKFHGKQERLMKERGWMGEGEGWGEPRYTNISKDSK
jgi:hypothetical protein